MNALEQFGVKEYRMIRGRGAFICETNIGFKLLREVLYGEEKYAKEDFVTMHLMENGFENTDTFCKTDEGKIVVEDDEKKQFYLKNWFDANECDVRDYHYVIKSVETIAKMHLALEQIEIGEDDCIHIPIAEKKSAYYMRKYKEMQSLRNYLRKKKKKSDFERRIFDSMGMFMNEGDETIHSENADIYDGAYQRVIEAKKLCHGSCTYHNVLISRDVQAVVCFERAQINLVIADLYDYMRKILEKYDWDIKLAYRMLDEYNKYRSISEQEFLILAYLFAFPEKYFKILDHYYNTSKSWLPDKDVEKLDTAIKQNEARMRFVSTLK